MSKKYSGRFLNVSLELAWKKYINTCISVVVQYLETGVLEEDLFLKLTSDKFPENNVRLVFAALLTLLRAALRQPTLKSEVTTILNLYYMSNFLAIQVFMDDLKQIK